MTSTISVHLLLAATLPVDRGSPWAKVCHDDSGLVLVEQTFMQAPLPCRLSHVHVLAHVAWSLTTPKTHSRRRLVTFVSPKFRFSSTWIFDGVQDPGFRFADSRAGVSRPSCLASIRDAMSLGPVVVNRAYRP
ncbi:hypothetical protein CEP54_004907 [Fusarium duplospermum]|uniref:Secreted protein n=1 Tax=Fusarium duplospermum TaxID=1325734 RepID=A0A428QFQ5_9HYPO|nr:hypothetical protein CEP54_004907 [Fusarium duplospermum]